MLKVGCVNGGWFNPDENKTLPAEIEPLPELSIRRGDVLISRANTRELVGGAAFVDRDHRNLLLCDKLFRLRFNEGICLPRYYAAFLTCGVARGQIELDASGASQSMVNIGQGTILDMSIPLPTLQEQVGVLAFLDRETGKIDALVAEQERLMALLKEKRQAVISQAVTKGLHPNAKMKPSGLEWLGEVPEHWDVKRVKHAARLESGHTPSKQYPEYWEGGDIEWVSLNDSKYLALNDYISDTAEKITKTGLEHSSARLLPEESVVFTRDATIGLAAITTKPMAVSQHLIAWCPTGTVLPLYLLRVFNVMKPFLDAFTFGATIKTIGMPDVRKLVTPVPPLDEQREIVAFIDEQNGLIDTLTGEATRAINLLKERRAALISAAVTGKIDVRDLADTQRDAA